MQLTDKIISLFPQTSLADFSNGNIVLQDDGVGPYIATWKVPGTLKPSPSVLASITAPSLALAQVARLTVLSAAYQNAVVQDVLYTSKGGVTKTFQADEYSVANLQKSLLGCQAGQTTPAGFFWVSVDNTRVPFSFLDLQGLAAAIFASAATAFAHLQAQKYLVSTARTATEVQGVVW